MSDHINSTDLRDLERDHPGVWEWVSGRQLTAVHPDISKIVPINGTQMHDHVTLLCKLSNGSKFTFSFSSTFCRFLWYGDIGASLPTDDKPDVVGPMLTATEVKERVKSHFRKKAEKRTIVLDGKTVELHDNINWVARDGNGMWAGFSIKPEAFEGNEVWDICLADGDCHLLYKSEPYGFWKNSLFDLNNLPESSLNMPAVLNQRMKYNDRNPPAFIAKTPPEEEFNHTCRSCGKPCHMTNIATVCKECAP